LILIFKRTPAILADAEKKKGRQTYRKTEGRKQGREEIRKEGL
jgi:hypothetical protein